MKGLLTFLLFLLLASCTSAATSTETPLPAVPLVRRLATVDVPPTQAANGAIESAALPTAPATSASLPTPTVYVGVFIGVSEEDAAIPNVDAALYQGTLGVPGAVTTPTPTPAGGACLAAPDLVFGTTWANSPTIVAALGCAGEIVTPYIGSSQVFERGVMYFIPTGEIWAIAPGGAGGGQYWHVPQAPPDQGWTVPAPEGLRVPTLGFGAMWRAVDGVRQTLGFARIEENAASLAVQRFTGGALLRDSTAGQVFVLIGGAAGGGTDSGTVYGPY